MKGAIQNDNGWCFNAAVVAIATRQLDGHFIGLCARIAEKSRVHIGGCYQFCAQLFLAWNAK